MCNRRRQRAGEPADRVREVREGIFKFALERAYVYATQRAYTSRAPLTKQYIMDRARTPITNYIQGLLTNGGTEDGDHAFMKCARAIARRLDLDLDAEEGGDRNTFTFGNIQKMINMTVKILYCGYYFQEDLRECFRNCHCPMDGIMINIVREQYGEHGTDARLRNVHWSQVRWSHLVFQNTNNLCSRSYYDDFQQMVRELAEREGLIPIEYDFVNWNGYVHED